tara:strand:- start:2541 stop:4397 length:1857 start_codon:yes stop_codon:yes gene_type:complete
MKQIKNESKSILFVDSSTSIEEIINIKNTIKNIQIFTFDYSSHKVLIQHNIAHEISDNYISEDDLNSIQAKSYEFSEWYKIDEIKNFQNFEEIDLGSLFKIEFFVFLLPFLKKIIEINNIINSNQNYNIYAPNQLYDISKHFEKNLKLINKKQNTQKDFFYDTLSFEFIFFSFKISQQTYKKLKNILNRFFLLFFKSQKQNPNVLLVEFNTILYKDIFSSIKKHLLTSVFYGLRRPPIWNLSSFFIFRNSNCKISPLSFGNKKLNSSMSKKLNSVEENFNTLTQNYDKHFNNFFSINNFSFWKILKPYFIKLFQKNNLESIENIEITKKMLENLKPKHVVLLSESGKTEQITLKLAKKFGINSILLQHALFHDGNKGHDYNHFTGSILNDSDNFLIWGNAMYRYAEKYDLSLEKITKIGSTVHDQTFQIKKNKNHDEGFILVAAQGPLNMHVKDYTVEAHKEYEHIIRTICKIAKQNNKKLIIKLHPYEDDNAESIIAKEIDPNISVIKKGDIIPLIHSCSFMISISTSMSNVILDSHILEKPVIRIPFGEWHGAPDQLRQSSCHNIKLDEFDSTLKKLFSDKIFYDILVNQGSKFINECLDNQAVASDNLTTFLQKN